VGTELGGASVRGFAEYHTHCHCISHFPETVHVHDPFVRIWRKITNGILWWSIPPVILGGICMKKESKIMAIALILMVGALCSPLMAQGAQEVAKGPETVKVYT